MKIQLWQAQSSAIHVIQSGVAWAMSTERVSNDMKYNVNCDKHDTSCSSSLTILLTELRSLLRHVACSV